MNHLIASAFIDELESIELEKLAFDITDPKRSGLITRGIETRWLNAGMDPKYVKETLRGPSGMRAEIDRVIAKAGPAGTALHRGAQERVRDIAREYAQAAPGRKTVPTGIVETAKRWVTGKEPKVHTKVQQKKPRLTTALGDTIRDKLGLEPKAKYAPGNVDENLRRMLPESDEKLIKGMTQRGNELRGVEAAKDIKKGTSKGLMAAAEKTLLPGLKALPTPLKIGGGIAAGLLGKKLLFGDGPKTTISVG